MLIDMTWVCTQPKRNAVVLEMQKLNVTDWVLKPRVAVRSIYTSARLICSATMQDGRLLDWFSVLALQIYD